MSRFWFLLIITWLMPFYANTCEKAVHIYLILFLGTSFILSFFYNTLNFKLELRFIPLVPTNKPINICKLPSFISHPLFTSIITYWCQNRYWFGGRTLVLRVEWPGAVPWPVAAHNNSFGLFVHMQCGKYYKVG